MMTEKLFVEFCQGEKEARKDKIIEELAQIERWEDAKSAATKHYNEMIKESDLRIKDLRAELSAGGTKEDVEVCWKMDDPEKGKKALYRLDTMKRIRIEEMGLFDGAGTEDEPDSPMAEDMEDGEDAPADGEPVKLKPAKTIICDRCGRCDGTEHICARCGKRAEYYMQLPGLGCVCEDCFYGSDKPEDMPDKTDKTDKADKTGKPDPPTPEAMEDGAGAEEEPVKLKPVRSVICESCNRCDGTGHICARCGKPAEYYIQLPGEGCVCDDCQYVAAEDADQKEVCYKCGDMVEKVYHTAAGKICYKCIALQNHKKYVELNERIVKCREAGKQMFFRAMFGYNIVPEKADLTCFRFLDHEHSWGLNIYEPGRVNDGFSAAWRMYDWLIRNGVKRD